MTKKLTSHEKATREAIEALGRIAEKHNLCPTCLTFHVASIIEDQLEAGNIHHSGITDDEFHPTVQ